MRYTMDKRDDLTIICDELEQCKNKICCKNEIVCVRRKIRQYINGDRNRLLKLKVLVKIHDDGDRISFLSQLSSVISMLSLCLVIIHNTLPKTFEGEKDISVYACYAIFALVIIIVIVSIYLLYAPKINKRKSWRRYVDVVIEELLKEEK